jgi:hypothetical protein
MLSDMLLSDASPYNGERTTSPLADRMRVKTFPLAFPADTALRVYGSYTHAIYGGLRLRTNSVVLRHQKSRRISHTLVHQCLSCPHQRISARLFYKTSNGFMTSPIGAGLRQSLGPLGRRFVHPCHILCTPLPRGIMAYSDTGST